MPDLIFSPAITNQYIDFQNTDKAYCKKLNALLKDIARHPRIGEGRPERLKNYCGEVWSRRINQKDRLVYRIEETGQITIIKIEGHYKDK